MMHTFKSFVVEAATDLSVAAKLINSECQPWLALANGKQIYRAMFDISHADKVGPAIYRVPGPVQREPRDSEQWLHEAMNSAMLKHGKVAFRSNAFFAKASTKNLEDYGSPYVMYPIGPVKYCWSDWIFDPTEIFTYPITTPIAREAYRKHVMPWLKKNLPPLQYSDINDTLEQNSYDVTDHQRKIFNNTSAWFITSNESNWKYNTGLDEFLTSPKHKNSEIMIKCRAAYFIPKSFAHKIQKLL